MDSNTALRRRILVAIGAGGLSIAGISGCGGSDSSNQPATSGGAGGSTGTSRETGGQQGGNGGSMAATGGNRSNGASGGTAAAGGTVSATGGLISARRPFLVGSEIRTAATALRDDWIEDNPAPASDSELDPATGEILWQVWLNDALEEHASIAAFARFSLMMLAHGAPAELVSGAQRASLDEIRHARACFSLAHRYSGVARGPGEISLSDALSPMSLPELAALTVREGCVGETLGVILAQEQLAYAKDAWVRGTLQRLVSDETRHSELAWRFVRWALDSGGVEVRRAVVDSFDALDNAESFVEIRNYNVDVAAFHAHGRVTCAEARDVTGRALRDVIRPSVEALLALTHTSRSVAQTTVAEKLVTVQARIEFERRPRSRAVTP